MTLFPLYHRAFLFAAALGLGLSAAGAAQAFTFEDQSGSAGGQGFTDLQMPGKPKADGGQASRFSDDNGRATYKSGNNTFYFGSPGSFDQRYNSDKLFDPYYRDGRR